MSRLILELFYIVSKSGVATSKFAPYFKGTQHFYTSLCRKHSQSIISRQQPPCHFRFVLRFASIENCRLTRDVMVEMDSIEPNQADQAKMVFL